MMGKTRILNLEYHIKEYGEQLGRFSYYFYDIVNQLNLDFQDFKEIYIKTPIDQRDATNPAFFNRYLFLLLNEITMTMIKLQAVNKTKDGFSIESILSTYFSYYSYKDEYPDLLDEINNKLAKLRKELREYELKLRHKYLAHYSTTLFSARRDEYLRYPSYNKLNKCMDLILDVFNCHYTLLCNHSFSFASDSYAKHAFSQIQKADLIFDIQHKLSEDFHIDLHIDYNNSRIIEIIQR
jgi:hypothetical protein